MTSATTDPTATFDQARADAFGERMLNMLNDVGLAMMLAVGHRTRLLDAMAEMEPATSAQIAEHAGLNERYVREWLGGLTAGQIVEHDPEAGTYHLPAEHAAFLTRAARPNNLAATMQYLAVLASAEDQVVEAFRHGRGVPYSAYHRFHEVMAEESDQTVIAGLFDHILPLVPELPGRLEAGIDVLDVGCGSGRALMAMAERYPNSRFHGLDLSEEATGNARAEAERRGLSNVTFEAGDATTFDRPESFDAVFTFDAIHDQARPDRVLANIRRALRPGGVYLMQDIGCATPHHANIGHPLGAFMYTISCMHCMSVSLAQGGMGLGAAWGRELAQQMLADAGFESVELKQLPHDIQNDYYVMRV